MHRADARRSIAIAYNCEPFPDMDRSLGVTLTASRTPLLLATVSALALSVATPAVADGGVGGNSCCGTSGGSGGGNAQASGVGGTGYAGSSGTGGGGGGGGGAGPTGGTGGYGGSNGSGPNGGQGGPGGGTGGYPGLTGGVGIGGSDGGGGGGGGGGAHGSVNSIPGGNVTGGNGGYGGDGSHHSLRHPGGGGGGGGGGYGISINSWSGAVYVNSTVTGGRGGNGGDGLSNVLGTGKGGDGGAGGVGLLLYGTFNATVGGSGLIQGGNGGNTGSNFDNSSSGANGGTGLSSTGSGSIVSYGRIYGGNGGSMYSSDQGPAGGNGVSFSNGGSLTNHGTIGGGQGGYGGGDGGTGGIGVSLSNGASLTNHNTINGGGGGKAGNNNGGTGGVGVALYSSSSTLLNYGTISGGQGGTIGTYGSGGQGGSGAVLPNGGYVSNSGTIQGGNGSNVATGGTGLVLSTGQVVTLRNLSGGTINGGQGGIAGSGMGGTGGAGASVGSGYVLNNGTIKGGTGGNSDDHGGTGGTGLVMQNGTLINTYTIQGGTGGDAHQGQIYGSGGSGLQAGTGVSLTNSGTIVAGNSGSSSGYYGSTGSSSGAAALGPGAIGIVGAADMAIVNAGTISGGLGASGSRGTAIAFGGGTNRLELRRGSIIVGNVDATTGNNDTFALGGADSAAFDVGQVGDSRQYRGFEKFEKTGASTWTLTGTTAASGPWTVNQGALIVNGSLAAASGLTVNPGGLLGGSGTLPHVTINGGTLSPGNSIGTINVQGNFVHNGGTHQLEIDPAGQSDRVAVTGTATINGPTVQLLAAQGSYANSTTYTIVNATAGLTGAYGSVVEDFAFLTPSLSYDANNAYLTLALGPNAFSSGGITPNQKAVGAALDASFANASGDFATVIGALAGLTTAQGPAALSAISGQPWANFGTMNVAGNALFMNALGQQMALARGGAGGGQRVALAEACEAPAACQVTGPGPWSAWVNALGGLGSVLGDGNAGTMTYNLGGVAAGVDYRFDPRFLVGLGVGYAHGTQWTNGFLGQGWSDSVSVALYGSFSDAGFYVDALAGYAWSGNQLERQINIPGLSPRTANGSTGANQFLGQVEGGYRIGIFERAQASVTPFGRLQISSVNQNGFTESGAGSLGLNVAQQTTTSVRSTIGADLAGRLPLGPTTGLDVALRLGWMHEFADTSRPITAAFTGAPTSGFTVFGATPARNSAVVGFSASTAIAEATSIYLRYDGQVGGGTDNHALNIGLRMTW